MNCILKGMIVGMSIAVFMTILPFTGNSKYYKVMDSCEEDIPEDKECMIIAVRAEK